MNSEQPKFKKLKMDELNRLSAEAFSEVEKIPVVVVLDNIRSLHNVGSVFRTADAFRIEKLILCGITAKPPHREIQKTALGATETVNWEHAESTSDALSDLKAQGYEIAAVEQTENSIQLDEFEPDTSAKYVLVLGNEVEGVSQEALDRCDISLEIPQDGTKHSLNVSVASGILLWHFFKTLR